MSEAKAYNNILVTRLRFMGDIILTTPLLQTLRTHFPAAHLGYLAESPYHTLLQSHPCVDSLYVLDRHKQSSQFALIRQLRQRKWDLAIDLFGNPRSALLTFLSGASMRIGGDFRGRRMYYTHRIQDDGIRKTAIQFHMQYLLPLGLAAVPETPFIQVTEDERAWAAHYLAGLGYQFSRPIIGIHPGATWPAKKWLEHKFAELAAKLHKENTGQILFTMGPGEEELVARVLQQSGVNVAMAQPLSLRQLAAVLQHCAVFVANDCGPMHLAPAVGTPVVGIFGPGEPDIWFPYNEKLGHRLVYHTVDCSHCHRDFCDTMICMQAISVDDVFSQVVSALTVSRH
jgi:heptosyltransferase III